MYTHVCMSDFFGVQCLLYYAVAIVVVTVENFCLEMSFDFVEAALLLRGGGAGRGEVLCNKTDYSRLINVQKVTPKTTHATFLMLLRLIYCHDGELT